ncbi:MAG: hypothetical protein ACYDEH_09445 [Acidimicrobiales bacterium]
MRLAVLALAASNIFSTLDFIPSPAANGAATPTCRSKQLSVTVRTWVYNPSTLGTVFEVLPITITNDGARCVLAGIPKIAPVGVRMRHAINGAETSIIVVGAAVSHSPLRPLFLAHGHAAYTYLDLVYPIGDTATARKWNRTCEPSVGTGITIFVVPGHSIWNRDVAVTVPNVCTTGRANDLRSGPLSGSPPI